MNNLNQYIQEKLNKINSKNSNSISYKYFPKDKKELGQIIHNLIKKRGNEANLNDIDTSEITDMSDIFYYSNFDGDISNWDVSNVEDMGFMFNKSFFTGKNGDLSNWDVSNVKNMRCMFYGSNFNGDLSNWDVSNVKNMRYMFAYSNFNKDISNWNVSNEVDTFNMFINTPLKNTPKWYKHK